MKNFEVLKPVTLDFFNTANLRVTTVMDAKCSVERLMETLSGDTVWTEWAPAISKVEWTCDKPFKQGATRTVYLAGGNAVKENFFVWEEGEHIAFYVEESTMSGMVSFGEDYIIEKTADGIRLTWTVAIQLTGIGAFFIPASRMVMGMMFKRWLKKYKKILES